MLHEPCARCGRTLLELRREATRDSLRGSVPLCAVPGCPLVRRVLGFGEQRLPSGLELQGPSPPAVFVGRHGYPKVAVGPLLPPGAEMDPGLAESPADWARHLDIAEILAMRSRLVRSKTQVRVDQPSSAHALDAARELAMAERPVETEVTLKRPPKLRLEPKVDGFAAPMGPSVDVVDARVLSSPSVPRKVDAIVSDLHVDAATGTQELYEGGISPYHIQRLLSVGLLGQERRRRLVPTRWSITATDDIIGKQLIEEVKRLPVLDAPEVYASSLFGNVFAIILLPRVWSFEMIEAWQEDGGAGPAGPSGLSGPSGNAPRILGPAGPEGPAAQEPPRPAGTWQLGHDWEPHAGRTTYADSITGAYYAARLSVLEALLARRRQAAPFVYREITEEYWAPLGVWVIREGVKHAMAGKRLAFEDVESAVRHVARRSRTREWTRVAVLPKEARVQRTLRDFGL